jgi:serine/threonine protein kinase
MNAESQAPADPFAGKYHLLRMLGKGAMGEVWLAEERGPRNFTRRVAVKKLLSVSEISEYATDSFVAEAQVIARLDHPNIVRLIEFGSEAGALFLVLDFVDGPALDKMLKKGPLSPTAVAFLGREIARALEAVHAMCDDAGNNYGVVHRDVTPSNILVSRDGRVRLTDFGVARISGLGGDKTETGVFKGKLPYMPPEQARGENFDGRADLFSLAMTLFEALIGRRLRHAESQAQLIMKIANESLPRVVDLFPGAPPALAEAIDLATEVNILRRTSEAGAFAAQLDGVLRDLGASAEREARDELRARVALLSEPPGAPLSTQSGARGSFRVAIGAPRDSATREPEPQAIASEPSVRSAVSVRRSLDHTAAEPSARGRIAADPSTVDEGGPPTVQIRSEQPRDRASRSTIVLACFVALLVGGLAAVLFFKSGGLDRSKAAAATATASAAASLAARGEPTAPPMTTPAAATPSASASATAEPTAANEPAPTEAAPPRRSGPARSPAPRAATQAPKPAADDAGGTGTLQVVVLPWADVTVDGKGMGTTPIAPISLAPGPHVVVLRNAELGASRTLSVQVKPGKPTLLRVDLRKTDP